MRPETRAWQIENIHIHGFVSQGFMISDRNNYLAESSEGSFEFNEAAINFSRHFDPNFHMGCQIFSRDIGDVGNNKIELDWALANYRLRDSLGFRLGRIKVPHGLYNETRDVDMLRTFIFLPPVYYDISRSTINAIDGIGVYGNLLFDSIGSIDYQIINGVKNIDPESGWSRYMERRGLNITEFDTDYAACAAISWHPGIEGLRLGTSGIFLDINANADITTFSLLQNFRIDNGPDIHYKLDNLKIQVGYLEYTFKELILAFEYMTFRGDLKLIPFASPMVISIPIQTDTFYLSLVYRLSDILEMGGYYSVFWPDVSDRQGTMQRLNYLGWHKEAAICFRADITDALVFKAETHLINGGALMMPQDNLDGIDQRTALFLLKLTYSF
ncbi:MAG: hypothetical protein OMM_04346 [Candidatus Magnetoglobus multicellularis str. Araruama]|uniref:Alginate export domain-containing protein n=1 Tax=Candidatus Magnetoglobus multicellularis str. Araruama TaxID=890399 RepID=A0A1V1P1P6_9BACT|nr:MAG: hypothetical protein OMM_04346 [Candidatus Magnetoglobus multicellularis str. Araruama]